MSVYVFGYAVTSRMQDGGYMIKEARRSITPTLIFFGSGSVDTEVNRHKRL